jgi:hydroxyacylglutathione hydrolase
MNITQIVCKLYSSNIYLLEDINSNSIWLIDAGGEIELPKNKDLKGVFVTHTHIDHIIGLNTLIEKFPECNVYTNTYGKIGLYNEKANLSYYHESSFRFIGHNVKLVKDGDIIQLFDGKNIVVHETPGHNPSSLTFVVDDAVFTGDAYIPGVPVVTKLPNGNREQAQQSVQKILAIANGKTIYPGHSI